MIAEGDTMELYDQRGRDKCGRVW